MSVLFVTGTDTGVGKTVATAALAVASRAAGLSPYVVKPAQTGVAPGEAGDLETVRSLATDLPGHEGVRLPDPLAPDTAARVAGVELPSLIEQRDAIAAQAEDHHVLVEGAGGILVSIGHHWNLLDLAASVAYLGVPVSFVVVARAGLGTLNHTGLTVQAIQHRELTVEGVIIGSWPAEPDVAAEQNLLDLPVLTGVPILGRIPEGAGALDSPTFADSALGWVRLPK